MGAANSVLIIIPTAGSDLRRLEACITSVEVAADSTAFHIVLVLCPASREKERELQEHFGSRATVCALDGPFNYCRSINHGVTRARPQDAYVLFLNDDVTFVDSGAIRVLVATLAKTRWACVGPYILFNPDVHDDTWPTEKSNARIERQLAEVRTNAPVSGCCALWDRRWLERIGPLDEEFGIGWGMDEADLCLRAVRAGARYGRQDAVAIKHVMHASFGSQYTQYTGAPHMRSLRYFHQKYGNDVDEWGRSHHWDPLPDAAPTYYSHPLELIQFSPAYELMRACQHWLLDTDEVKYFARHLAEHPRIALDSTDTTDLNRCTALAMIDKALSDSCALLGALFPMVRFALSGSTAKHTFVWGLSDIDVLCLLPEWGGRPPRAVVTAISAAANRLCEVECLHNHLVLGPIHGVRLDLVPGCYDANTRALALPNASGDQWVTVRPDLFVTALDELDKSLGNVVRPAIRLARLFYALCPSPVAIPGHHLEALALKVSHDTSETSTVVALVHEIIRRAPILSREPLVDSSGQFQWVDHHLGDGGTLQRLGFVEALSNADAYRATMARMP